MDSPFMNTLAESLAGRGLRVARFEFPYMAGRREGVRRSPDRPRLLEQTWHDVIHELGSLERIVIGGKSMGGRIASMVADEAGVRGLVCLGYPFHPPGRPEKLRTAHLADLMTPTLIVQGERDPFGTTDDVTTYELSRKISFVWLPDGDHSFKPRKKSGHTESRNLELAIKSVRAFVDRLMR